jgi:hypothetical protein
MVEDGAATAERARARELVPTNEILREITRGGLAGLIAGVLVAGIGGRLVMRLAALLVPESLGRFTENGNRIGDITAGGTFALILFIGLFVGLVGGSLWVTMRPWLPDAAGLRAIVSIPIAIALGTKGLVEGANPDFRVLGGSEVVVASLVTLVALYGPVIVLADVWLEARLPHAAQDDRRVVQSYGAVTLLGLALGLMAIVPAYLGPEDLRPAGIAIGVVGVATLASWRSRVVGRPLPGWIAPIARIAIVIAVIAGSAVVLGEVSEAISQG